ncbi:hypothetical protein AAT19DRAFT_11637 [Rhodotorula toruloides]|uniref:Uncharacterized protein n=1 Tax=Rhodotorula toruloides TaxID=5286 RepID=A0A2S9ZW63_RHOTO|nr:hypothetical protein AAT19DRAFT_11637 [Rhodotorula toruloides]
MHQISCKYRAEDGIRSTYEGRSILPCVNVKKTLRNAADLGGEAVKLWRRQLQKSRTRPVRVDVDEPLSDHVRADVHEPEPVPILGNLRARRSCRSRARRGAA